MAPFREVMRVIGMQNPDHRIQKNLAVALGVEGCEMQMQLINDRGEAPYISLDIFVPDGAFDKQKGKRHHIHASIKTSMLESYPKQRKLAPHDGDYITISRLGGRLRLADSVQYQLDEHRRYNSFAIVTIRLTSPVDVALIPGKIRYTSKRGLSTLESIQDIFECRVVQFCLALEDGIYGKIENGSPFLTDFNSAFQEDYRRLRISPSAWYREKIEKVLHKSSILHTLFHEHASMPASRSLPDAIAPWPSNKRLASSDLSAPDLGTKRQRVTADSDGDSPPVPGTSVNSPPTSRPDNIQIRGLHLAKPHTEGQEIRPQHVECPLERKQSFAAATVAPMAPMRNNSITRPSTITSSSETSYPDTPTPRARQPAEQSDRTPLEKTTQTCTINSQHNGTQNDQANGLRSNTGAKAEPPSTPVHGLTLGIPHAALHPTEARDEFDKFSTSSTPAPTTSIERSMNRTESQSTLHDGPINDRAGSHGTNAADSPMFLESTADGPMTKDSAIDLGSTPRDLDPSGPTAPADSDAQVEMRQKWVSLFVYIDQEYKDGEQDTKLQAMMQQLVECIVKEDQSTFSKTLGEATLYTMLQIKAFS